MRVCVIGGGIMGEAILRSLLAKGVSSESEIAVSEARQARRDYVATHYKVKAVADGRQAVQGAEVVVLAVKPQDLTALLKELAPTLGPDQLVLSIAAGVGLDTLQKGLNHGRIVRAMPNMPAQIGEGMSVWTATSAAGEKQKESARVLLSALGKEIYVSEEKYLDMATALSGSGPAYVFLFIEALTDAGVHIGLPRETAEKLVLETVIGSARAVQVTGKHPAELRNMVTSPGGTTAEALLKMEKGRLRGTVLQAVLAAYEKAKALGK